MLSLYASTFIHYGSTCISKLYDAFFPRYVRMSLGPRHVPVLLKNELAPAS